MLHFVVYFGANWFRLDLLYFHNYMNSTYELENAEFCMEFFASNNGKKYQFPNTQPLHSNPFISRYPLTITKGEGCTLTDADGKKYLDFVAGISTCILGHSNKELIDAVTKQISTVHHVSNLYYTPSQGQLAAWICENSCADKAFFCNSGAEANEGAIKLARKHANGRGITDPVIITAKQSFHGRTLAAISATGQPKYHEGFKYGGEMVQGFQYVTYNNKEELQAMVDEMNTTPDDIAAQGR